MAGFGDLSTDPNANTSIGGTNVAESCPPANINNAIRILGAYGRALFDTVAALGGGMPLAGGTFLGAIFYTGRGAFRHNADSTLIDGRDYHQLEGTALPATPAEGMRVWFYS